jgi:hypothetical protein
MRAGLLMSAVLHVALVAAVAIPYQRQLAHGETMPVELVSVKDTGDAFKDPPPSEKQSSPQKEEPQPDWSKLQLDPGLTNSNAGGSAQSEKPQPEKAQSEKAAAEAPREEATVTPEKQRPPPVPQAQPVAKEQPQQKPVQQASAQQPPQQVQTAQMPPQMQSLPSMMQPFPQAMQQQQSDVSPDLMVDTVEDQGKRIATMMGLPEPNNAEGFGSEAESKAKLDNGEISQFNMHLRSCFSLPAGVSPTQKLKLVVRVALRKDGSLVGDPVLIEAPASALGPSLFMNAVNALKSCAPYTMLPAAKYNEWRVLDLNFSPDEMSKG